MAERIYVTPRSATRHGHPALNRLTAVGYQVVTCEPGEQPDENRLLRDLPQCVGYLAGVEHVSAAVLQAAASLKVISRNGVGTDAIDMNAAKQHKIAVLTTAGANAQGVAELTVGLMFGLARAISFSDHQLKNRQWKRQHGIELVGRRLGVIGCGRIGRSVTQMGLALGMGVRVYDVRRDVVFHPAGDFQWTTMDELIADSDFISLHCPPAADGTPIVTSRFLAKMKSQAYLINTARAELLDEHAVLEALNSGRLAGLAMDAFRHEPPGDHPLVMHPNVIATPHIGALTDKSVDRAMHAAVDNLLNYLRDMKGSRACNCNA